MNAQLAVNVVGGLVTWVVKLIDVIVAAQPYQVVLHVKTGTCNTKHKLKCTPRRPQKVVVESRAIQE